MHAVGGRRGSEKGAERGKCGACALFEALFPGARRSYKLLMCAVVQSMVVLLGPVTVEVFLGLAFLELAQRVATNLYSCACAVQSQTFRDDLSCKKQWVFSVPMVL